MCVRHGIHIDELNFIGIYRHTPHGWHWDLRWRLFLQTWINSHTVALGQLLRYFCSHWHYGMKVNNNVLYSLMAILSFFSHSFQLSHLDVCNQGVYILVQWGKDLWPFLCSPHGCLSFHWENSLYGENRVIVNHAYMLSFLSGFVICFSNDMLIEKQCTIWRIFSRCHCWLLVSMSPLGMQCRNLGVGHKGMKKKGIAQYFMMKWFISQIWSSSNLEHQCLK